MGACVVQASIAVSTMKEDHMAVDQNDSLEKGRLARDRALHVALKYGTARLVARDIYQICSPLPNNPLRSLNSYVVLEGKRPLVIDLGFGVRECYEALTGGLHQLGIDWSDVDVFFTHGHPDHCGMVNMVKRPQMSFYAGFEDFFDLQRIYHVDNRGFRAWMGGGYELLPQGCSRPQITSEERQQILDQSIDYSSMAEVLIPVSDVRPRLLHGGDIFERGSRRFEVIETRGHAENHLCLYDREDKLLVCGDQVLARITPVVSSFALGSTVLRDFILSMRALGKLDVSLALSGHRDLVYDVPKRAEELVEHHMTRCDEILAALHDGPLGLIDVTKRITWRSPILDWDGWPLKQKFFSVGETLAHISYLEMSGKIFHHVQGKGVAFQAE